MCKRFHTKTNEVGDMLLFDYDNYIADIEYKQSEETIVGLLNTLNDEKKKKKKELEELNNLKNLCGDYNIKLTDIYDIVEETIEYYTKKMRE